MRGLLLGTGRHDSALPDVPAVARTLADLARVLPFEVVLDPANPMEMGEAVASAADGGDDVLVVYYVGHGLVTRSGNLYLATVMTDPRPNRIEHTGFSYVTLRRYLLDSPARAVVVILDCCFSGRAIDTLAGPDELADLTEIDGGYVLAAAGRNELALAPVDATHTAFSGALLELLESGDPELPELLTLDHVHRHLSRVLPARGFPRPRARSQGRAGELVLGRNRAFQTGSAEEAAVRRDVVTDAAAAAAVGHPVGRSRGLGRRTVIGSAGVLLAGAGAAVLAPRLMRSKAGEKPEESPGSRTGVLFGGPLASADGAVWTVRTAESGGRAVVVIGRDDGALELRELETGSPIGGPLTGHTGPVYSVATGVLDGRAVAVSASVDGTLRLWDLASRKGRALGGRAAGGLNSVAMSVVDGRPVAVTGGDDGTVRLWDLTARSPHGRVLGDPHSPVKAVAVGTLDGRPIALSGGADRLVRRWDLTAAEPAGVPIGGHDDLVGNLTIGHAHGRAFGLSASEDGTARVWDLTNRQPVGRALGDRLRVAVKTVAAGTLAGRPVAFTGSDDGALRMWDLTTGTADGPPLAGPSTAAEGMTVFSRSGRTLLLAATWEGTTWKWDLGPS